MEELSIETIETTALVDELASREGIEHARLIGDMFASLSLSGSVDVLIVRPAGAPALEETCENVGNSG